MRHKFQGRRPHRVLITLRGQNRKAREPDRHADLPTTVSAPPRPPDTAREPTPTCASREPSQRPRQRPHRRPRHWRRRLRGRSGRPGMRHHDNSSGSAPEQAPAVGDGSAMSTREALGVRPEPRVLPSGGFVRGRELQREAWEWVLAQRKNSGSLPSGKVIADKFGRHERWGRLFKQAGVGDELVVQHPP